MITVSEALTRVLERCEGKLPERVTLREATSLVLAQDVTSDVDSPPHDKSLVDGYALRTADVTRVREGRVAGPIELLVIEEVTAGDVPQQQLQAGQATRIMTGAPVPQGADAVVMVEQTEWKEEAGASLGVVQIDAETVTAGQCIMRQAASMRRGQRVLDSGCRLRDVEIGLLAEVGCADVMVVPRPRVAVLATGNELVDPTAVPTPGKIRNSNGPMLIAAVEQAGGWAVDLGVARDDEDSLRELIGRGLEADILILSGGVSAGVLDLVPQVLTQLEVEQVFHKVQIKPGKPLWFGVRKGFEVRQGFGVRQADATAASGETSNTTTAGDTLVFGLPGNPVSSLICFHVFVRAAISELGGRGEWAPVTFELPLASDFQHRGGRPTYHPAILEEVAAEDDKPQRQVRPLVWQGSSDLCTLAGANAIVLFPAGDRDYVAGETVECMHF